MLALGTGAAIVAAATSAAVIAYGVSGRSSTVFGPSVFHGSRSQPDLALTFDDGPSEATHRVLEVLDHYQVSATFFQCGANIKRCPGIASEVSAAGHEIGNHTFSHQRLCPRLGWQMNFLSRERIYQELAETQQLILQDSGIVPRLFRAPYGLRWFGLAEAQRRLNLLGVMWTVIGHDWEWPARRVAQFVLERSSSGGIVCLHDGRDTRPNPDISETLMALKMILPVLKDRGYGFRTVSDLLAAE